MERRELPGVGPVSAIGAGLETPEWGAELHRAEGLVRVARRQGISLFDLSANDEPRVAEQLVGATLAGDEGIRVVSRLPSRELPNANDPQSAVRFEAALRESARRLGRSMDVLALRPEEAEELQRSGTLERLARRTSGEASPAVALRLDASTLAPNLLEALLADGVRIYLAPWNLLDRGAESFLFDAVAGVGGAVLALDPHAAGRLDGRRVLSSPWERGGRSAPLDPTALRREMQPVLELGYLTEGARRTMIEAATRFALDPPVVSSTICPLQDPALTAAICDYPRSPPFSDGERARLRLPRRE
jgi:aryl-alcohol dehydrogenase-like predicted oxidoreductase